LRAAICDDELIQAIGRGRGVNRTADNPLEVHVLADVALPLVHDRILGWTVMQPDVVQRMLLAGIALDSPADASVLHSTLFTGPKHAQKEFERAGFKRQNPIRNIYRGLSLKQAVYLLPGSGRSAQHAYWLSHDDDVIRQRLESVLGTFGEWAVV
jgi:hypothetical protein